MLLSTGGKSSRPDRGDGSGTADAIHTDCDDIQTVCYRYRLRQVIDSCGDLGRVL
jgi:hypothetical protein